MNKLSLLEFYKKNNISPVRQDIPDLQQHFERRESLYRQLGILPGSIRGKRVLEIGPGSGHNSLYTVSLKPAKYVLLEPNPQGVQDIHKLFSQYRIQDITVVQKPAGKYHSKYAYDFVFCEGLLGASGVSNPKQLFKEVARFVPPGGILVVTCTDEVSYLSELLRRLLGLMITDNKDTLPEKVAKMLPAFSTHLARLPSMTKRYDDWIIDNLINPASCGQLFTIPDALTTLPDQFEFYASSPHFVTDWRWYKTLCGKERDYNNRAVCQYWENLHNFLDSRYTFPASSQESNVKLYNLCKSIRQLIQSYENEKNDETLIEIQKNLWECIALVRSFSQETAIALREATLLISQKSFNASHIAEMDKFAGFFGRGQQYVSLTRV